MIAKLTGRVDEVGPDWLVLDVGGVGYLVFGSAATLRRVAGVGETVSILIETHVREDHIHLYGFADAAERDWFRLLQTVQGVGARVALAILSVLAAGDLALALAAEDKAALTQAAGVGARLAGRIVGELKDQAAEIAVAPAAGAPGAVRSGPAADAISALVNLGYRRVEAMNAVTLAAQTLGEQATVEGLIRDGLRELAP